MAAKKPRPDDHVPDLASLLREKMTRPSTSIRVILDQAAALRLSEMEAELVRLAQDPGDVRMGQKSPQAQLAKQIEELTAQVEASVVTLRFEALGESAREAIREAMGQRDDNDELNLRIIAAQCVAVVDHEGNESASTLDWTWFRDLRESHGVRMFDQVDEAATRALGGLWSVPFSPNASHILATQR